MRSLLLRLGFSALLMLIPLPCRFCVEAERQLPDYSTEPLSAYDSVLRQVADSTGWDWRLLAAVVYHESRFHNEARSNRGATGLMQVRSERYSEEMLLDPSTNVAVGARYLKKLEGMFTAASPVESLKFALAAYNLGDGRMKKLIRKASEAGADTSRWESVSAFLPKGHRTITYVEKVLDTYDSYRRTYPR
jgi:membrane-bound lytic murein transglycosylase F